MTDLYICSKSIFEGFICLVFVWRPDRFIAAHSGFWIHWVFPLNAYSAHCTKTNSLTFCECIYFTYDVPFVFLPTTNRSHRIPATDWITTTGYNSCDLRLQINNKNRKWFMLQFFFRPVQFFSYSPRHYNDDVDKKKTCCENVWWWHPSYYHLSLTFFLILC